MGLLHCSVSGRDCVTRFENPFDEAREQACPAASHSAAQIPPAIYTFHTHYPKTSIPRIWPPANASTVYHPGPARDVQYSSGRLGQVFGNDTHASLTGERREIVKAYRETIGAETSHARCARQALFHHGQHQPARASRAGRNPTTTSDQTHKKDRTSTRLEGENPGSQAVRSAVYWVFGHANVRIDTSHNAPNVFWIYSIFSRV